MVFSWLLNIIRRMRRSPRLSCKAALWTELLTELHRRGGGRREAGAFLLGVRGPDGRRNIKAFLPYDDIDPNCLRGAIVFDGSRMDEVWHRCAALGLCVVADVHTHPGGYGQSSIDQANPMIPEAGHMALIIPNFADRLYGPGLIGVYEFRGRQAGWRDHSGAGRAVFQLEAE